MSSPVRTAVIIAAGRGTRLGAAGAEIPKGFIQLGAHAIVEESIVRLRRAGIERIIIVTGHQQQWYEGLVDRLGPFVHTVHNPQFANCGSLFSLACARADLQEDFLLLESDLLYEQRALTTLIHGGPDAVLLSGPTGAGDEVWVETRDERLVNMSKDRRALGAEPAGEFVGITRLSRNLFELLMELALERLADDPMLEYEVDGLVALAAAAPLPCVRVDDLLWAEIDDAGQLLRARTVTYPAIVRRDGPDPGLEPPADT